MHIPLKVKLFLVCVTKINVFLWHFCVSLLLLLFQLPVFFRHMCIYGPSCVSTSVLDMIASPFVCETSFSTFPGHMWPISWSVIFLSRFLAAHFYSPLLSAGCWQPTRYWHIYEPLWHFFTSASGTEILCKLAAKHYECVPYPQYSKLSGT
jgi:hypothetical protein